VSLALESPWEDEAPGAAAEALLRRPFSVAGFVAGPGVRRLELLYAPVGRVTRRLTAAAPGAAIDLLGPLGTSFPWDEPERPLLVAGGRGIAPLAFVARERARRGLPLRLLYGARAAAELVTLEELPEGALEEASEDGGRGLRGTALDLLDAAGADRAGPVMACGPHGMLAAVARWALTRDRACWVSVEETFACGMGLCGGCAVPSRGGGFRWACRDGPVIAAAELDWPRWTA
jgi:dihydroorotate dehydrogenase electron transfer subunit